jgi:hypothetical protein
MKRCPGRLQYDRKFQTFIFLIGYINVNKGVFCLIISYLRIKSYNVLNYNNCSTDWSFPLKSNENEVKYIDLRRKIEIKKMTNSMRNEVIFCYNLILKKSN